VFATDATRHGESSAKDSSKSEEGKAKWPRPEKYTSQADSMMAAEVQKAKISDAERRGGWTVSGKEQDWMSTRQDHAPTGRPANGVVNTSHGVQPARSRPK